MPLVQAFDKLTGSLTAGPIYVCRCVVPVLHRLRSISVVAQSTVLAGVMEVKLRKSDANESRGGAQVGETLTNDRLKTESGISKSYDIILADSEKAPVPKRRMYFLSLYASDAAARFDEPTLLVEYHALESD